jgi:hypothetical protein
MSDNQQPLNIDGRQAVNWLQFAVESWAISVEVFLRREFGWNYIGAKGALVLLLIPVFLMFWQGHDPRPLLWFLVAYLVMCAVARAQAWRRRSRGDGNHSYYSGWPRLMKTFRGCSEVTVKQWIEPLFVGIVAALIGNHNVPLAAYLLGAAVCLLMSVFSKEESMRRRVMAMNDAVNEQEIIAERFRDLRGENF